TSILQQLKQSERWLALEKKLPSVLEGKEKASAAELCELARLCLLYRKRFEAAVRLFENSFQMEVPDRNQLRAWDYHHAASAALQAAHAPIDDGKKRPQEEKDELRRKALRWMQADLELNGKRFKDGMSHELFQTMWRLEAALNDARLA